MPSRDAVTDVMTYVVDTLTPTDADQIITWRYPPPYDLYDLAEDAGADLAHLLLTPRHNYFAVRTRTGNLAGFCCFGEEGRVPGWAYTDDALDVGVGMRPGLTGQGQGHAFVGAVLAYGLQRWPYARARVTIAAFNVRSRRAFQRHGLHEIGRFIRPGMPPQEFVVLAGVPGPAATLR